MDHYSHHDSNFSTPSPSQGTGMHHISPDYSRDANEMRGPRRPYQGDYHDQFSHHDQIDPHQQPMYSPDYPVHPHQHHQHHQQYQHGYSGGQQTNYPMQPQQHHHHQGQAHGWPEQIYGQNPMQNEYDDDDWRVTYAPELELDAQEALEVFLRQTDQYGFYESDSASGESEPMAQSPQRVGRVQPPATPLWKNFVRVAKPRSISAEEMPSAGDTISVMCDDRGEETSCYYQVESISDTVVGLTWGYNETVTIDLKFVKEFYVMGRPRSTTAEVEETSDEKDDNAVQITKEKPEEYKYPEVGSGIRLETSRKVWKDLCVLSIANDVLDGRDAETGEILTTKCLWNYRWEYSYKNPTWSGNGCKVNEELVANGVLIDCRDVWIQCLAYAIDNPVLTYDVLMLISGRVVRFEWLNGLTTDENFEDFDLYSLSRERADFDVLTKLLPITGYAVNAFNVDGDKNIRDAVVKWIDEKQIVICSCDDGLVAVCDYDEDQTHVRCVNREHVEMDKLRGPFTVVSEKNMILKGFEWRDRFEAYPASFVEKVFKNVLVELNRAESDYFCEVIEVDDDDEKVSATGLDGSVQKGIIWVGKEGLKKFAEDLKMRPADGESFSSAAVLALRCFYNSLTILVRWLTKVTLFQSPPCRHYTGDYKACLMKIKEEVDSIVKSFEILIRKSACVSAEEGPQMVDFVFDGFWTKQEFSDWFGRYLTESVVKLTSILEESLPIVAAQVEVMEKLGAGDKEPVW